MNLTLAALLTAVWGIGIGYLLYCHGPAYARKMQAPILAEAKKRRLTGLFRPIAQWQLFIVKLGGVVFFVAGIAALVLALLQIVGLIDLE